jgi:hypothetical protein
MVGSGPSHGTAPYSSNGMPTPPNPNRVKGDFRWMNSCTIRKVVVMKTDFWLEVDRMMANKLGMTLDEYLIEKECSRPSLRCFLHHPTSHKLFVGDRRPVHGPAREEGIQIGDPASPVEPIAPFPKVPRRVFRADGVMRAVQPDLDVAEQLMDDRHVHASIFACTLHDGKVLVFVQSGVALEAIADDQRAGLDVRPDETTKLFRGSIGENSDPRATGDEALLVDALSSFRPC